MKPKSKVFQHFIESKVNEKTIYTCSFCRIIYKFKNATKFAYHLALNCEKTPVDVKNLYKSTSVATRPYSRSSLEPQATGSSTGTASTASLPCIENTNEKIHQALARAIYVSGAPLSLLEHPLWKDVLQMLNPDYSPPSRKVFSTSLLEKEYADMQRIIEQTRQQAGVLHLAIDGWSNIRNESILNVMLYTPKPYFFKFIVSEDNSHTADYLFQETSEILDRIGAEKFLAIVSDNAANMVKCGDLIKRKYAHVTWIGCLAHTLHLWIGDIIKVPKVSNLFSKIVDIIKVIKNSHIMNAKFTKIAKDKNIKSSLQLPVKTRWGSYLFCLQSFLKSKVIFQNMAINDDYRLIARIRTTLLDESMWLELEEMEVFLKPIVYWIVKLEGDYCAIHLVHKAFKELSDLLTNPLTTILLGENGDEITRKFLNRKINALKPVHLAAAILDPQNQGSNLTTEENLTGVEFIINTNISNSANANAVLEEFTNYKNRTELWQKQFVWEMANSIAPMLWWQSLYSKTKLGEIALRILSIPATSSSVERSFSTFSNLHTAKRNRLTTDRAGKLCFIAHNWKLINKPMSTSSTDFEVEEDVNIEELSDSEDNFSDFTPKPHLFDNEPTISLEGLAPIDNINEEDPLGIDT